MASLATGWQVAFAAEPAPSTGAAQAAPASFSPWLALLFLLALAGAAALGWLVGQLRERQRLAAQLQGSERELAVWLELAKGEVMWRCDAQGLLLQLQGQGLSALPVEPAAWLHKGLCEALVCTEQPALPDRLASHGRISGCVVRLQSQPMVFLSLDAAPLHDALGAFVGHVGVLRRMPALDQAAGSQAAQAPGPQALAGLAAANAANGVGPGTAVAAGASAAEDALSFSYTVSHDLRAPVRVVDGFARILKEDHGAQLDRVGNDHLDRVLAAAARMNQMIDALLAMARLSSQPLSRQPVDLSQLAQFVVEELRRGAPERQIEVHIEPGLWTQGDPTLLRQVLENLLGNAWKYTQRCHQPRLSFGRENMPATSAGAAQACYAVRDNGAGFDMRGADRLFGLFQRLHSASEFPGTGVGLASVKRIVTRHGGRIWAQAVPGQGAVFSFTLWE